MCLQNVNYLIQRSNIQFSLNGIYSQIIRHISPGDWRGLAGDWRGLAVSIEDCHSKGRGLQPRRRHFFFWEHTSSKLE